MDKNNTETLELENFVPTGQHALPPKPIPYVAMKEIEVVSKDLSEEDRKDKQSNRSLRETITPQIFTMMVCELVFIAVIIFILLAIPFINAISPNITIKCPVLTFLIPVLIFGGYFYYKLKQCPEDSVKIPIPFTRKNPKNKKRTENKEIELNVTLLKWLCFLSMCFALWFLTIHGRVLVISHIDIPKETQRIIMPVIETIFVKTTILAGLIIRGLFNNQSK